MSDAKPRRKQPEDIAILGGPTEDGQGAHLLRFREGSITTGEIRPVKEGEPITHSEVVRLRPLDAERRICAVETLHEPASKDAPLADELSDRPSDRRGRPARVATDRYRKNYDAIFDSKSKGKGTWSVN
jgi:hypothetical protein